MMPSFIEHFLDRTTMYRLLVYYLGGLLAVAAIFSLFGLLPYDPVNVIADAIFLIAVSWLGNAIFAKIWGVPANKESALITALILSLIITPTYPDQSFFFLMWAALLAMASKYLLAIKGKHVFNPAAFGVAVTALVLDQSATWWVAGNLPLLPFILAGGILVVKKLHRSDLVLTFLAAAIGSSLAFIPFTPEATWSALSAIVLHTTIFFFAFVMITEPLTTPPRRIGRIIYAAFVGFLFAPWVHVGSLYFTPELALISGNVLSYILSPKYKAILSLSAINKLANDTYEFVFSGPVPAFEPGQFAEWTLHADKADDRGNRRWFTIASSPTERDVRLGIKFYAKPSAYKALLAKFKSQSPMLAGSIAGDFVLPRNKKRKLAFIAGGIGVTPFRSMVKYLHDSGEIRDTVMFYSNRSDAEIAYKDVFDAAERANIGFKAVYTLTDKDIPATWQGERGYVDAAMIAKHMPDYKDRTFYISGPPAMVGTFKKSLRKMGVPFYRIKTDYFPGFA